MRVLILGGTGFIGAEIARRAQSAGHEVTCFNRGQTAPADPTPGVRGDLSDLLSWKERLQALGPEVVVHTLAHTEEDARQLVEVFAGTPTRLLVLGSQDCYEAFQQMNRGSAAFDLPLDEHSPLTALRYYFREFSPQRQLYDKNLMTDVLMAAHHAGRVQPIVFRLPMIWGPRDRQFAHRHGKILRRILDGQTRLVMGQQEQGTIWPFGYVENVAAAVVHAFERSDLAGKIYNLGEPTARTNRRWAELYAEQAGMEFDFRIVPDELLDQATSPSNSPPRHLMTESRRYAEDTGFIEPVPLREAILRTLAWARTHPEVTGPRPDYAQELATVQAWAAWLATR